MTSFGLATASLVQRKGKTLLMTLSVAIAIGTLTMSLSVTRRIRSIVEAFDQPSLVVRATYSGGLLPWSYVEQVKQVPGAKVSGWTRLFRGDDGKRYTFSVSATADNYPESMPAEWFHVEPEVANKWRAERRGMIVTGQTMDVFGWKPGQLVEFNTSIGKVEAVVIGAATGAIPGNVILHYEYLDNLLPAEQRGRLNIIRVDCAPERCNALSDQFEELFKNQEPVSTVSSGEMMAYSLRSIAAIPELLTQVGLLMLVVTVIISIATVSSSLAERRSQLATLRALGYTNRRVFTILVTETVLMCVLGGLLGAGLPFLFFSRVGMNMGNDSVLRNVTVGASTAGLGLLCSFLLGLIVAVLPARSASTGDVIHALEGR